MDLKSFGLTEQLVYEQRTGKALVSECRTGRIVRNWSKRQASPVQFNINASLRMHGKVLFSADMDLSGSFNRGLQALSSANITWAVLICIYVIVVGQALFFAVIGAFFPRIPDRGTDHPFVFYIREAPSSAFPEPLGIRRYLPGY